MTKSSKTTQSAMALEMATATDDDSQGRRRRATRKIVLMSSVLVVLVLIVVLSVVFVSPRGPNGENGGGDGGGGGGGGDDESSSSATATNEGTEGSSMNFHSSQGFTFSVRVPSSTFASTRQSSVSPTPTPDIGSDGEDDGDDGDDGGLLDNVLDSILISDPPSTVPSTPLLSSVLSDDPSMAPSLSPTAPPPPPPTLPPTLQPTTLMPVDDDDTNLVTIRSDFQVLEVVPHDTNAFTQGLEVLSLADKAPQDEDSDSIASTTTSPPPPPEPARYMLESIGLYGQSGLRVVEIATGNVVTSIDVAPQYFAEGCAFEIINEEEEVVVVGKNGSTTIVTTTIRIVQLTWREGIGLVYELTLPIDESTATLTRVGEFAIHTTNGEGWGVDYHPIRNQYIVSDGTSNLHIWEFRGKTIIVDEIETKTIFTFDWVDTIPVTRRFSTNDLWTPVLRLNELEWDPYPSLLDADDSESTVDTILANVWKTDLIVRIRLSDGKVTHQYDMASLSRPFGADVLNGIAAVLDSTTDLTGTTTSTVATAKDQYWITGKWWPQMYRIRFMN